MCIDTLAAHGMYMFTPLVSFYSPLVVFLITIIGRAHAQPGHTPLPRSPARPIAAFHSQGARSPSTKDRVRRWVGVGLYEVCQALILFSTVSALFSLFQVDYPGVKISRALFKRLMPWYVRRAKRETCLCKACENYKHYQQAAAACPATSRLSPVSPSDASPQLTLALLPSGALRFLL